MMIKVLGAGFVTAGFGLWGFSAARTHLRQEQQLRRLLVKLNVIHSELSCRHSSLPDLFTDEGDGALDTFFYAFGQALERQTCPDGETCLRAVLRDAKDIFPRTREILLEMSHSLGVFDLQGQLRQLEMVITSCEKSLVQMAENKEIIVRNYRTFGLCAGAALAILLL